MEPYGDINDESVLRKAFDNTASAVDSALILRRLAQLRGEHAVSGLLASDELKQAKQRADEAYAQLEIAQAQAQPGAASAIDEDAAHAQAVYDVLGWDWEARVAEDALEADASWQAAHQVKQPVAVVPDKEIKAIDAQLRKAIISKGPVSPEVKALRQQKEALTQAPAVPVAPVDEKKIARLRKRLIGVEKTDGERRWYTGGKLNIAPLLQERQQAVAVDVELALLEQANSRKFNAVGKQRTQLLKAERKYETESQAWAVHQAAINRAKARAERAHRPLVMEAQSADAQFESRLKERPRQLLALFLRNTPFIDHVIYAEWTGKRFRLEATISVDHDEQPLVTTLLERGAVVAEHPINAPSYSSWAKITGGDHYEIKFPSGGVLTYVSHHNMSKTGKLRDSDHPAPRSERGQLRFNGFSPSEAVELLVQWGIAEALETEVPYDLIYRGSHRYGRLTPWYEPFASGREEIAMPDGHMILHGLTGISSGADALERLKMVVETGGLKSIAERRRMNMNMMTMSPLGDIASGIDMGVPTKIGTETTYGGQIFFAMHPSILHRRDLWFSYRDFGGGHNRYPEYLKYAEKLGQKGIHLPCPVKGRQKHLRDGLGKTNEVYFQHEISWNDVHTLFVANELAGAVRTRVKEWKDAGLLPKSLRVEAFGHEARGEQSSTWHVDEKTGEVVYLAAVAGDRLTLSQRIQRCAASIQREWNGDEEVAA